MPRKGGREGGMEGGREGWRDGGRKGGNRREKYALPHHSSVSIAYNTLQLGQSVLHFTQLKNIIPVSVTYMYTCTVYTSHTHAQHSTLDR